MTDETSPAAPPPVDLFAELAAATVETYGPIVTAPPVPSIVIDTLPQGVRSKKARPPMAERIEAERKANKLCHDWVVAANVRVDTQTAKHAAFRQSFRTEFGMRIDALEVSCRACRRPIDDVGDDPCEAKIDNTHLIGGTPGERAKRKVHEPTGRIEQGPRISRMGMDGYSTNRFR